MKVKDIYRVKNEAECRVTHNFTDEDYGAITEATDSRILEMKVESLKRKNINGKEVIHIFASEE